MVTCFDKMFFPIHIGQIWAKLGKVLWQKVCQTNGNTRQVFIFHHIGCWPVRCLQEAQRKSDNEETHRRSNGKLMAFIAHAWTFMDPHKSASQLTVPTGKKHRAGIKMSDSWMRMRLEMVWKQQGRKGKKNWRNEHKEWWIIKELFVGGETQSERFTECWKGRWSFTLRD